ncbi:hypothetical protein AMTRI_Chr05g61690 [Amborella trichopoda]
MDCRLIGFDMVREAVEVIRAPSELQSGLEISVWVGHVAVLDWNGHVSLVAVRPYFKLIVWFLSTEAKKWEVVINIDMLELGFECNSESELKKGDRYPSPVLVRGGIYGKKIMSYGFSSGRLYGIFPSDILFDGYYLGCKPTICCWDLYGGEKGMGRCGKKRGLPRPSLPARKRKPQNSVQHNSLP